MEEILDAIDEKVEFNKFRPFPILLEGFPWIIALVGLVLKNESFITIGFCTMAMIYTFLSWYIFKSIKFTFIDIFISSIIGIGLAVAVLGLLFYFQNWEGVKEMVLAGHLTLLICLGIALIFALIKHLLVINRAYQIRLSWKLLSRILFLLVVYYGFNLNAYLEALFNQ